MAEGWQRCPLLASMKYCDHTANADQEIGSSLPTNEDVLKAISSITGAWEAFWRHDKSSWTRVPPKQSSTDTNASHAPLVESMQPTLTIQAVALIRHEIRHGPVLDHWVFAESTSSVLQLMLSLRFSLVRRTTIMGMVEGAHFFPSYLLQWMRWKLLQDV